MRNHLKNRARRLASGTNSRRGRRIALVALLALCSAPIGAMAQDKGGDKDEKKESAPKVKVERGAHGRKVYRITTGFVIEGRIQKPNAFYVLQRSQINYDWARLKKNFLPRILEATRKSPF